MCRMKKKTRYGLAFACSCLLMLGAVPVFAAVEEDAIGEKAAEIAVIEEGESLAVPEDMEPQEDSAKISQEGIENERTASDGTSYSAEIPDAAAFEREIQKALAVAKPEMEDWEKALAIHDYLILYAQYDVENYNKGEIPDVSYILICRFTFTR